MSKPWINCHLWKGKSSQRKNSHVDGLTAGLMFHNHLTSILALNLWTLYVTRTRSKAISLETNNSPKNLWRNEKNIESEEIPLTDATVSGVFSPSTELHHLSPIPKCFVFFRGAYLFSFGILLIRWWCLNGFFLPRQIFLAFVSREDRLKELLFFSMIPLPGSLQVCICSLWSFTSCFCFSRVEDVTLWFWLMISSAGEKVQPPVQTRGINHKPWEDFAVFFTRNSSSKRTIFRVESMSVFQEVCFCQTRFQYQPGHFPAASLRVQYLHFRFCPWWNITQTIAPGNL